MVAVAQVVRDMMSVFAGKFDRRIMTALLLSMVVVVPLAAARTVPSPNIRNMW